MKNRTLLRPFLKAPSSLKAFSEFSSRAKHSYIRFIISRPYTDVPYVYLYVFSESYITKSRKLRRGMMRRGISGGNKMNYRTNSSFVPRPAYGFHFRIFSLRWKLWRWTSRWFLTFFRPDYPSKVRFYCVYSEYKQIISQKEIFTYNFIYIIQILTFWQSLFHLKLWVRFSFSR